MSARKRVAGVLISGSGSNLQALINACAHEDFPARIGVVISNKSEAYGLKRAQDAGIATHVINHRDFSGREAFDAALHAALLEHGVELVCLAGFMRLLTPGFVQLWHNRLLNIHPSLLPAFKGLHTHEAALKAGVRFSGCTVHLVRAEMDVGPIVIQAAVPVHEDETPETLGARVLAEEHRCYPQALRWLAEGRLVIENETVRVTNAHAPDQALRNPQ